MAWFTIKSLERSRELAMRIYAWARYHAVVTLSHVQSNPFCHPFYPDVTHVKKDTRPSPALPYRMRRKVGRGLGTRLANVGFHTCRMCKHQLVGQQYGDFAFTSTSLHIQFLSISLMISSNWCLIASQYMHNYVLVKCFLFRYVCIECI